MWRAIQYVTTPITLIAFVVAVSAWLYRARIFERKRLIETAKTEDRAELVLAVLKTYPIPCDNLTRDQKFELLKKLVQQDANRFRTIAIVAVLISILTAAVLGLALVAPSIGITKGDNDGAESHYQAELRAKSLSELNEVDETKRTLAVMKVASYGEDALPAMKMALGSEKERLRSGAVMVLSEMYKAETVNRDKLFDKVLGFYGDDNPDLCRGVLEWVVAMGEQLPEQKRRGVFARLQRTFKSQAEDCAKQDEQVALQAAKFLFFSPFEDSREFVMGMAKNCKGDGARETAVNALPRICASLKQSDRDGVTSFLEKEILPTASKGFRARVEAAITRIHSREP
jgi:hypothetical protein